VNYLKTFDQCFHSFSRDPLKFFIVKRNSLQPFFAAFELGGLDICPRWGPQICSSNQIPETNFRHIRPPYAQLRPPKWRVRIVCTNDVKVSEISQPPGADYYATLILQLRIPIPLLISLLFVRHVHAALPPPL
jgi:hypothetical protein